MISLTVDQAIEILAVLGCDDPDPVVFRGQEMDVSWLAYEETPEVASKIRIRYYGYSGKGLKQGTLQSMVKDRLRV